MNFGQVAKPTYSMLMAEIKGDSMGKQKDFLIDWLEDVGYEMGYDLENHHEVDKLIVSEYLRQAYLIKDSNRERELIKMEREQKIRDIVRSEMQVIQDEALVEHLKQSHDPSDDVDEEEGNNSHP